MINSDRQVWIDASAGIAGDMLLGALVDAGADLSVIQARVDAVLPDSIRLVATQVTRAGLAATKVDVEVLVDDPPHRTWTIIKQLLAQADLPEVVRSRAQAVFARLAEAEGQVHGVPAEQIHFHEVGALDSIADIVGVCAALDDLGIGALTASEVALGSGTVRAAHGEIPVPVPAVTRLASGWQVLAGGTGELTTPTGMALLASLCDECMPLPRMRVDAVGLGAGTKDFPGRANVTRVIVGVRARRAADQQQGDAATLLEANIDDLDPRLWPPILAELMDAGASDAWLVPVLMKKGRPAHVLSVLCPLDAAAELRDLILATTTTIGVRQHQVHKYALPRAWVSVDLDGGPVAIKLAHRDGEIVQATPEFDDVLALADRSAQTPRAVLSAAIATAEASGLVTGGPLPAGAASVRPARPSQAATPPTSE